MLKSFKCFSINLVNRRVSMLSGFYILKITGLFIRLIFTQRVLRFLRKHQAICKPQGLQSEPPGARTLLLHRTVIDVCKTVSDSCYCCRQNHHGFETDSCRVLDTAFPAQQGPHRGVHRPRGLRGRDG